MKKILILVIFVLAVGAGFYFYKNNSNDYSSNVNEGIAEDVVFNSDAVDLTGNEQGQSSVSVEKLFTMTELSKHADRQSCYSVVNGDVYDLTNWIDAHPGGEKAILSICGKDGSSLFNKKHGGKEKQEAELLKMKIGVLSN
jgi:cytochrome b involved in lipid metabolism